MQVRSYTKFSELVRAIRRKHGLSQRAMARALRISAGYVGQWEMGVSLPSPDLVEMLCKVYDIRDTEHVQRIAYAAKAPEAIRDALLSSGNGAPDGAPTLSRAEGRVLGAMQLLEPRERERLADHVEGWVEALTDESRRRRRR